LLNKDDPERDPTLADRHQVAGEFGVLVPGSIGTGAAAAAVCSAVTVAARWKYGRTMVG
jgi:hypothetical protein